MQWIIEVVKANTGDDGKVDLEKLGAAINAAFPKHAVPKDQYNTVAEKLKTANETLETLQNENKDVKQLQSQIEEYKQQVAEKDKELIATRNQATLKEKLQEAGAKDIDYMMFKLGDLETDDEGNYKDLENKIKALKENEPKWFGEGDDDDDGGGDEKQTGKGGYKVHDNKLKPGKPSSDRQPETLGDALAEHYNTKK